MKSKASTDKLHTDVDTLKDVYDRLAEERIATFLELGRTAELLAESQEIRREIAAILDHSFEPV